MPYSYSTFAQLKTQLALRLSDSNQIFWVNAELGLLLTEALRAFGLCSAFWRDRGTFASVANTAFYDFGPVLKNGSGQLIRGHVVTDQYVIQQLQYALLENASSQSAWAGTDMFAYNDLANAIQNRLNQFHADTGLGMHRTVVNVASPPIGRQVLDQSIIDVRRVAWQGASPQNYFTTLWREDERLLTAADQGWSVNPGTPEAYSIMAPPPLQLQLAPIPISSGHLELLTINSTTLNPASGPTILDLPDDLTPAIKWGALSDLLGKDGPARDQPRAQAAESMYQLYVKLARVLPVILHTELNGVPMIPVTLQEMDSSNPNWENITADGSNPVQDIVLVSIGMIALSAVPDKAYSVTMDVVRATPTYADTDPIQLGREQVDMILDYAEHLALFKVGGEEWASTQKQAQSFIQQALTYNQRLSAAARTSAIASAQSTRLHKEIRRRSEDPLGLGALQGAPANA
jgi:hypothetical protein